jgi:hypothetical protein
MRGACMRFRRAGAVTPATLKSRGKCAIAYRQALREALHYVTARF